MNVTPVVECTLWTRNILGFLSVLPLVDEKPVKRRAEINNQSSPKLYSVAQNNAKHFHFHTVIDLYHGLCEKQ